MQKLLAASLLLFAISFLAFDSAPSIEKDLVGVWIYSAINQENQTIEYSRIKALNHDGPAIEFKEDGTLVKRQNAGWCGTPPISYGDYQGAWKLDADKYLSYTHDYWGGKTKVEWEIISISKNKMIVKQIAQKDVQTELR